MSNLNTQYEADFGMGKKSPLVYIIGFILCIILTIVPFAIVHRAMGSPGMQYIIILSCALLQFLVQVICFLRLNASTTQSKVNLFSFVFTMIVLLTIVGGSLWIMYNLNYNMMH